MGIKLSLTAECTEKFRVVTQVMGHEYVMDEPVEAGGDDTGAVPGAMLMVALAGCKAMVARMYIDKHDLPVRNIEINLDTDFEQKGSDFELTMDTEVVIDGDLTEQQLATLTRYVNTQCPVQKILEQANTLNTTVRLK